MNTALTQRALHAINTVILSELECHDGVLLRLAYNLADAWNAGDELLTLELCATIEGCAHAAQQLKDALSRLHLQRPTVRP